MSSPEPKLFIQEEPKEPTILDWVASQDALSAQVVIGLGIILLSLAFVFYHLYTGFFGQPEAHLFRSVHLTFVFLLTFLFYPSGRKSWKDPLNRWFLVDLVGIFLSVATQIYYLLDPDSFILRVADPSPMDLVMGTVIILLVMETARRVIGNTMVILSGFFIFHALYADKFFGFLLSPPSSYGSIISHVVMEETGIYTIPLATIASFVVLFLILGAFLVRSGLGKFFLNMAFLLVARHTGGPAKVSVVSSGAFATISGSAVANVMVDGCITIPLMKRSGYRPEMAGAVEALSSCFGMFTPPVMGAAAFIIAAFLGIPYLQVCLHAAIPAFLFYFSVFLMVDFHGRRHGLRGVPGAQLPTFREVMAGQWFLIAPVIVLLWLLLGGYTPSFASFWAIILTFVISFVRKESRISLVDFIGVFEDGAKNSLIPATACAAAGIIIGSTTLSGLALKIGATIISLSMEQLWLSLFLIVILSIILGMGLPTTGVYVTLAVTVIPIIVKIGVLPIGAHLFAFYYGVLSNVIPPVAIASFAAAGIAGGKPMRTAWTGFYIALPGLILPILFVYRPELLWVGDFTSIVYQFMMAANIVLVLVAAIQGWFLGRLPAGTRLLFGLAGMSMAMNMSLYIYFGLALSLLLYAYQVYRKYWRFPELAIEGEE